MEFMELTDASLSFIKPFPHLLSDTQPCISYIVAGFVFGHTHDRFPRAQEAAGGGWGNSHI